MRLGPCSKRSILRWLGFVCALAPIFLCGLTGAEGGGSRIEQLSASFSAVDRRLEYEASGRPAAAYELRIETNGLSEWELGADVNEPGIIYLPPLPGESGSARSLQGVENIFFFNSLREALGWELVIRCDANAVGTWKLNGRFSSYGGELGAELIIPIRELEHGENLLHVRSATQPVKEMYFRRRFAAGERVAGYVSMTPRDWSGKVSLYREVKQQASVLLDQRTIAKIESSGGVRSIPDQWWNQRGFVSEAALAVGRSLLSSQVKRSGSLFEGGFNLVYDPTRGSHRMPHWIWAWGPSIDLLLRLSKTDMAQTAQLSARFRAAAVEAARRSLEFDVKDPAHLAVGVSTVRWEPSRATPQGWAEYISTADSLFLAGWGWMSAYAETREPAYLGRMRVLVAAAERLMKQYPVIPQDWIVERNGWTPHTLDESVFGTIGFRRLFEVTGAKDVAVAGERFLDSHLKHMGRGDGLLARAWLREENKEIWDPDIKGHAWVIEGYLDANRLSGDHKYLALANQLAQRVTDCQSSDGSWTYLFKRAGEGDPADDKGTAIWAYLFYDLYQRTNDPQHLAAGRRALGWCLRHQYRGDDPNLDGAIFHPNSMAYVRRRPMTILYTTTFFGLALLEELALEKSE